MRRYQPQRSDKEVNFTYFLIFFQFSDVQMMEEASAVPQDQYSYGDYYYRTANFNNCDFKSSSYHSNFQLSDNLTNKLDTLMFPQGNLRVEQVLNMVHALRLRHNWNKSETTDVIEFAKILDELVYENIDLSGYLFSKLNLPVENLKAYTFLL